MLNGHREGLHDGIGAEAKAIHEARKAIDQLSEHVRDSELNLIPVSANYADAVRRARRWLCGSNWPLPYTNTRKPPGRFAVTRWGMTQSKANHYPAAKFPVMQGKYRELDQLR